MAQSGDEINILDFFGRMSSSIKKSVQQFIAFCFKNILLFSILVATGIAGGFVHYKFSKPVYFSELILSSNYLSNGMCAEMIQRLENYVEDKTPELLAKKLDIDSEIAKGVLKIEFDNFDTKLFEKYKDKDTVVLGLPFRIKVYASDYNFFNTLQPAIINYLENNPHVIEQKTIWIENTKLIKQKLQKEQAELDSLKKVIANHLVPRGTQGGFVFGQPLDPLTIYKEGINLYKEELEYNSQLILNSKNIRVYSDFEIREKPYRPKKSISMGVGAIVGLVLGFLIAFIKSFLKK